jgi:hypothetical protein
MMAISVNSNLLSDEQMVKLFSNPISGIACEIGPIRLTQCLQNIRYSKSMILKALNFWIDYSEKYYNKIRRIWSPLDSDKYVRIHNTLMSFKVSIGMIKDYSDSYLFSHRYIKPLPPTKYSNSLKTQRKLLQDKLGINFIEFQEGSLQPYHISHDYGRGIEFTVFPNEHPYIPRQKITRVGMTEKGNIFVLHGGERK